MKEDKILSLIMIIATNMHHDQPPLTSSQQHATIGERFVAIITGLQNLLHRLLRCMIQLLFSSCIQIEIDHHGVLLVLQHVAVHHIRFSGVKLKVRWLRGASLE
jgi:hypothetical protein